MTAEWYSTPSDIFRRLADGTDRIMDLEVFEADYDKSIEILRKFKAERNL